MTPSSRDNWRHEALEDVKTAIEKNVDEKHERTGKRLDKLEDTCVSKEKLAYELNAQRASLMAEIAQLRETQTRIKWIIGAAVPSFLTGWELIRPYVMKGR